MHAYVANLIMIIYPVYFIKIVSIERRIVIFFSFVISISIYFQLPETIKFSQSANNSNYYEYHCERLGPPSSQISYVKTTRRI